MGKAGRVGSLGGLGSVTDAASTFAKNRSMGAATGKVSPERQGGIQGSEQMRHPGMPNFGGPSVMPGMQHPNIPLSPGQPAMNSFGNQSLGSPSPDFWQEIMKRYPMLGSINRLGSIGRF